MKTTTYTSPIHNERGFTLVEVVIVLVVAGILMAVALRTGTEISESARIEDSRQELECIADAIVGNQDLNANGSRSDFGYVGDVGALPPNLAALTTNPGLATWNGPYLRNSYAQLATDVTTDAWGVAYQYSGGVTISSTGSGSTLTRTLAASTADLLRNTLTGAITDFDGTPPGGLYCDSITLALTYPNGSGGTTTRVKYPADDGYFRFDSLPIGQHRLRIIYEPTLDTLERVIAILPGTTVNADQRLSQNFWSYNALFSAGGGSGILEHVAGSDTARGQGNFCDGFLFWIRNPGTASVNLTSITVTWAAPSGYYSRVRVGTATAYNRPRSRKGTGELTSFARTQAIRGGQSVRIWVDGVQVNRTGNGARVTMSNATLQIRLSDGSTFNVVTAGCL